MTFQCRILNYRLHFPSKINAHTPSVVSALKRATKIVHSLLDDIRESKLSALDYNGKDELIKIKHLYNKKAKQKNFHSSNEIIAPIN